MSTEHHLLTAAAKEAGVSPHTVRAYCRAGMLDPVRDSSGRRLFTADDIETIRRIYRANMARRPVATR